MSVGVEEVFEFGYLGAQLSPLVGVGHEHAVGRHFDNLHGGLDVGASQDGILGAGKGLVLHELEASAVIDERIAGNARLGVVGLGEAAVDDHEAASRLDGVLAL